jgi:hypothetical protein
MLFAYPKRAHNGTIYEPLELLFEDLQGGLRYVAHQAGVEAKDSEKSRTGVGHRRGVFRDGGYSIRNGQRTRSGYMVAEYLTASRNLPRRGRNL